jgi:threonine dehydrogenase-like Zn-dependent dehydrogenase
MTIRDRYRAAVIPSPGVAVRMVELAGPRLEPGAALLHTLASEVCGTDVHLFHGRLEGVSYPLIPGHVSVGVIAALRGRVRDIEGVPFAEGDVVTFFDVHETCNHCYHCLVAKQPNRCPARRVYGITYGAGDGLLGGWAEAIWIKPGVKLVRLPRELDADTFIAGGCGMITALHAIDRAAIRLGDSVAVLGVGPVGLSAIAFARLAGAGAIIAVGAPADRLALARRMGAHETIDLDSPPDERSARVRAASGGRGVDIVIEAAGPAEAVPQALDMVRDGGRVVVAGQYTDSGETRIEPHRQINRKHVELRGCWGTDYAHVHRAVELAARHQHGIPWRDMIGARYPLADAGRALADVEARAVIKAVITPNP